MKRVTFVDEPRPSPSRGVESRPLTEMGHCQHTENKPHRYPTREQLEGRPNYACLAKQLKEMHEEEERCVQRWKELKGTGKLPAVIPPTLPHVKRTPTPHGTSVRSMKESRTRPTEITAPLPVPFTTCDDVHPKKMTPEISGEMKCTSKRKLCPNVMMAMELEALEKMEEKAIEQHSKALQ